MVCDILMCKYIRIFSSKRMKFWAKSWMPSFYQANGQASLPTSRLPKFGDGITWSSFTTLFLMQRMIILMFKKHGLWQWGVDKGGQENRKNTLLFYSSVVLLFKLFTRIVTTWTLLLWGVQDLFRETIADLLWGKIAVLNVFMWL